MTREERLEKLEEQKALYADVCDAIKGLLTKNKKYTYSNVESTHMAETQSINDLRLLKESLWDDIISLSNSLQGSFVKLRNYR